ncbi:MAG TPA: ATP-binding protein, partial [Chitinophagaceae bacterium]|nr:ATP-binding protein [Chitinophagaceae bacterium]
RQYMLEILMGTRGVYQFYNSYEPEFLLKASPAAAQSYKHMKSSFPLQPVTRYLDTVFSTFNFGNKYEHDEWRKTSTAAIDGLRNLQLTLLQNAEERVNGLYKGEQASKRNMLIFLILAMVFVISTIVYTISVITKMLTELKQAAQKISKGEPGPQFIIHSRDAIGSLAHSILEIDNNSRKLADAAIAIGNGDFSAAVEPRSSGDLLGNAIVKMKNSLQQLIGDLKNAQKEIDGLNKELELKVIERTAQLETVIKELESFSYSVSHDLRAPLRVISGYASILNEDYGQKLDGEAARITDNIISNANKMGQLIDDLIAFSKMGAKAIVNKVVDMKALAQSSIDELLRHEPANKYNIRIESLPGCKGDPNLLKQVWMNLIDNAIKYSSRTEHPCIEISSKEDAGSYVYFVKDNGVGFDMRYADKLFGVFQRLHSEEMFKGTGIGLALVKRIITRHHGEVVAESAPNDGATFYFTIPK